MADNTQPEALRLAELLELAPEDGVEPQTAEDAAAELRRLHTENTALQQGYAAARLEIESLRARGVGPDVSGYVSEWSGGLCTSDEAMDGIAKLYAAQPAGAQQPTTQPAPQQEAASVDLKTMELAESVGLIGPASRTNDLHAAIQRFHDLICANATIKAAQMAAEAISEAAPQREAQEPVAWYVTGCGRLLDEDEAKAEARHIGGSARAIPLYTVPQADSVTAPAAGAVAHTISDAQIEAMPVWRNFVGLWPESRREIVDAVVDLLAAAPTPPAQAAESVTAPASGANWQDISTAPKDGTRFVAVGQNYGLDSEKQHTCIAQWLAGCWVEVSDWNGASKLKYLTHWMPLPPLPCSAGRARLEDAARRTTEQEHAIRQGHEIAASDSYFEARPQIDSNDRRKVFQAGFERGWDAARATQEGK